MVGYEDGYVIDYCVLHSFKNLKIILEMPSALIIRLLATVIIWNVIWFVMS